MKKLTTEQSLAAALLIAETITTQEDLPAEVKVSLIKHMFSAYYPLVREASKGLTNEDVMNDKNEKVDALMAKIAELKKEVQPDANVTGALLTTGVL